MVFLNKPGGEKQKAFKKRLRDFASMPGRWIRQQITDQDGDTRSTWLIRCRGGAPARPSPLSGSGHRAAGMVAQGLRNTSCRPHLIDVTYMRCGLQDVMWRDEGG
jgi:hypothetical protein